MPAQAAGSLLRYTGRLGTHGFGSLSDRSWPILLKNSFLLEQKKIQGF